jgi:SARP family transcriptional regulator, regulator of embCAB operon
VTTLVDLLGAIAPSTGVVDFSAHAAESAKPVLIAHCFGWFTVCLDGQIVDTLSSRRTRNVLAYLLTHRRAPVLRDVLMDVFWPDARPDAARNCLHVALTGVRKALRAASAEPVLERRHDAYRLADTVTVWIDAEAFESACDDARQAERAGDVTKAARSYEAAVEMYEGDFLADDLYAEWTAPFRETLRAQAIDAQCWLIDRYIGGGDYGRAILLGQRLLRMDPYIEDVHRQLMICYALSRKVQLAVVQYHRCATALWSALKMRPSRPTTELYNQLRTL